MWITIQPFSSLKIRAKNKTPPCGGVLRHLCCLSYDYDKCEPKDNLPHTHEGSISYLKKNCNRGTILR